MIPYFLKRLVLVIPTLLGILTLNFFIVQLAPGGPVEQFLASQQGDGSAFMDRLDGGSDTLDNASAQDSSLYKGDQGVRPEVVEAIKELYGFDKPIWERYFIMLWDFVRFDFGNSFFKGDTVVSLVTHALPVSISLGLWSTLIIYLVSIPLGIARAVRRGSAFDLHSGLAVTMLSAIPAFLLAMLLIIVFAGGSYWKIFPLRGLVSPDADTLSFLGLIVDYFHHITLPVLSLSIGGFAGLTLLTRNCFLDEFGKQYVETARAKGLTEKKILYGHVFRNAMLIVITGLPGTFIRILFTSALLVETVFSLNGLGLLGFEAALQRDYPVMFATLFCFTLIGMVVGIVGDCLAMLVDPRINYDKRGN